MAKQAAATKISLNMEPGKLAPYACFAEKSKGRLYKEKESLTRSCFRRDCDRVIHSTAFRRLEYKTQVFVNHVGDHYRTRLTHTLEVAQIARSVARSLMLNEDLAEVLALAHDLGHTPFGHAGEDALHEAMHQFGGFSHNVQTLKILTQLEHKHLDFQGLNLTWETLEGVVKHNGPLTGTHRNKKIYAAIPEFITQYCKKHDLELSQFASAEAEVAALADDIAYHSHDIEDGLRAGLLTVEGLRQMPLFGDMYRDVEKRYPSALQDSLVHEAIRSMIGRLVLDLTTQTLRNIKTYEIETVKDIRMLGKNLVAFSATMEKQLQQVREYLTEHLYRHYRVNRMTSKARRMVKELFGLLFNEPECLPGEWRKKALLQKDNKSRAVIVADFIAGMTDRYAIDEHKRLFLMEWKG